MGEVHLLATTCVPVGIRGALNKWMLEVLPGVFIGKFTQRVGTELWDMLTSALAEEAEPAYAAIVRTSDTEQGFTIETHGDHRLYRATDFGGITLITRHHNIRDTDTHYTGTDPPHPDW